MKKIMLFMALSLGGCSTYQESFDCPVGEGVRCASLSTINKKMDQGKIQIEEEESDNSVIYGTEFSRGLKG
ncbi:MAG: hypothetical protein HRU43_00015 [Simkaniaceae bacterium]|nr:hypothetical protein [Simkaniaceae bacterium]